MPFAPNSKNALCHTCTCRPSLLGRRPYCVRGSPPAIFHPSLPGEKTLKTSDTSDTSTFLGPNTKPSARTPLQGTINPGHQQLQTQHSQCKLLHIGLTQAGSCRSTMSLSQNITANGVHSDNDAQPASALSAHGDAFHPRSRVSTEVFRSRSV